MMLIAAIALGLVIAFAGHVLAPVEGSPGFLITLRTGVLWALPAALIGFVFVEDAMVELSPLFLGVSVCVATCAVLGTAFLAPERSPS